MNTSTVHTTPKLRSGRRPPQWLLVATLVPCSCLLMTAPRLKLPSTPRQDVQAAADDISARVAHLESRLNELETILFAQKQIDVFEAERRVAEARKRLADSRELFFKGMLSELQFQQDQFELDQLERELELAKAPEGHRVLLGEFELRDAERRLEEANYRVRFSESLLLRGYINPAEMDRLRALASLAEKNLHLAKEKLEAVKRLESLRSDEKR